MDDGEVFGFDFSVDSAPDFPSNGKSISVANCADVGCCLCCSSGSVWSGASLDSCTSSDPVATSNVPDVVSCIGAVDDDDVESYSVADTQKFFRRGLKNAQNLWRNNQSVLDSCVFFDRDGFIEWHETSTHVNLYCFHHMCYSPYCGMRQQWLETKVVVEDDRFCVTRRTAGDVVARVPAQKVCTTMAVFVREDGSCQTASVPVTEVIRTRSGFLVTRQRVLKEQARMQDSEKRKVLARRVVPKVVDDESWYSPQPREEHGAESKQSVHRRLRTMYKSGLIREFGRKWDVTDVWQVEKLADMMLRFCVRLMKEKTPKGVVLTLIGWSKRPHRRLLLMYQKFRGSRLARLMIDVCDMKAGSEQVRVWQKTEPQGYESLAKLGLAFGGAVAIAAFGGTLVKDIPRKILTLVVRDTLPDIARDFIRRVWRDFCVWWDNWTDKYPLVQTFAVTAWSWLKCFFGVFLVVWFLKCMHYAVSWEIVGAILVGVMGIGVSLQLLNRFSDWLDVCVDGSVPEPQTIPESSFSTRVGDLFSAFSTCFTTDKISQTFLGLGERLPKFVSYLRAFEWLFAKVPVFFSWATYAITGKALPTSHLELQMYKACEDVDHFDSLQSANAAWAGLFTLQPGSVLDVSELCHRYHALESNAIRLTDQVHVQISRLFQSKVRKVVEMESALALFAKTAQKRITPVWFSLYGEMSTGKSTQIEKIAHSVYNTIRTECPMDARYQPVYSANAGFHMNAREDYFDGYCNQPLIFYEELFQHTTKEVRSRQALFMQQLVSTQPFPLLVADMNRKGSVYITSDFCFTTRNTFNLTNLEMECPKALKSRQTVCCKIVPCADDACPNRGVTCDLHRRYHVMDPNQDQHEVSLDVTINGSLTHLLTHNQLVRLLVTIHKHYRALELVPLMSEPIPEMMIQYLGPRGSYQSVPEQQCEGKACDGSCTPEDRIVTRPVLEEVEDPPDKPVFHPPERPTEFVFTSSTGSEHRYGETSVRGSPAMVTLVEAIGKDLNRSPLSVFNELRHFYPLLLPHYFYNLQVFTDADRERAIKHYDTSVSMLLGNVRFRSAINARDLQGFPKTADFALFMRAVVLGGGENVFRSRLQTFFKMGSEARAVRYHELFVAFTRVMLLVVGGSFLVAGVVMLVRSLLPKVTGQSGQFGGGGQRKPQQVMNMKKYNAVVRQGGDSDVEDVVFRNIYRFSFGGKSNYALAVLENLYVTTKHSFEGMSEDDIVTINPGMEGSSQDWVLHQLRMIEVEGAGGLVFFQIPAGQPRKSILVHFAEVRSINTSITRLHRSWRLLDGKLVTDLRRDTSSQVRWGPGVLESDAMIYDMKNQKGFCGLPYLQHSSNGTKIVGLHCAGVPDENISYLSEINADIVRVVVAKFQTIKSPLTFSVEEQEYEGAQYQSVPITPGTDSYAKTTVKARLQTSSKLQMTCLHPESPEFVPELSLAHVPTRIPVEFGRKQLGLLMRKFSVIGGEERRTPAIDHDLVLNNKYDDILPIDFRNSHFRQLTMEEAVFGGDGFDGLDMSKSSGWPYVCLGRQRIQVLKYEDGLHPQFVESVRHYRSKLSDTVVPMTVVDALKDELLPISKVKEDFKVRLFQIGQLEYLVIYKMEMEFLWKELQKRPYQTPWSIGLNPHSTQWGLLYNRLNSKRSSDGVLRLMVGDFLGHEFTLPAIFMYAFVDFVDAVYPLDDEIRKRMRRNLIFATIHPMHLHMSRLYKVDVGNSSGSPLTAMYGCFASWLFHKMAWKYIGGTEETWTDSVEMAITIDDTIVAVQNKPEYNMIYLTEFARLVGMRYTSFDKRAVVVPYIDLADADYLKRQFVLRDGFMFAPLNKNSIYEAVMFSNASSRSGDPRLDICNTFRNMLIEAIHHGPDMYHKIYRVATRWVRKENYSAIFPGYDQALRKMVGDGYSDHDGMAGQLTVPLILPE